MESFFFLILILLGGLIITQLIYQPYTIIKKIILYFYKDTINRHLLIYNLKAKYKSILSQYNLYYVKLDERNKKIFEKRLAKFLAMKVFIPRGGLEKVTDEMKVLIGAKAIQITFGHPSIYFEHFWRILVYPDTYYSEINETYHKGEVNPRGFIIISWKNFVEGISDRSDGINLGLHEMAHALHLENAIMNNEYDFLDGKKLNEFHYMAQEEMSMINSGERTFFREYAGTNFHEFFAVIIESFFERPDEFKQYDSRLYGVVTHLMQQDPLLPDPVQNYFK